MSGPTSSHAFGRLPWLAAFPARERRLRPRLLMLLSFVKVAAMRQDNDRFYQEIAQFAYRQRHCAETGLP
ncbi:hypothetical protein I6E29_01620 [Arcanobacterium haemolyticum]|nr:hypothetical protein [Arcanobacterium haemolyticum]